MRRAGSDYLARVRAMRGGRRPVATTMQPGGGPATTTTVMCQPRPGDAGRCRGCDAPIVWFRTVNGKSMPMDADPMPRETHRHDDDGRLVWDVVGIPHWATCSQVDKFRPRSTR